MSVTPTPSAASAINAVQQKQAEPSNGMGQQVQATEPATASTPAADPQLEAFARKERQLHRMRKELEAEKQQWKQKLSEYETGYIPKQRLKDDPFGVLTEEGLGYDQLTEKLLSTPNMNDPAIRALHQKIKALEDRDTQAAKKAEEAEAAQYKQAINEITNEVKQLADSSDEYEMLKATGLYEAVVELIEQKYTIEGKLPDTEECCKQIEDYLVAEAERLAGTKKLQARLTKPAEVTPGATPNKQQQAPNQLKTITNAVSATPTTRLSEKERIARAKAAFYGQLKG